MKFADGTRIENYAPVAIQETIAEEIEETSAESNSSKKEYKVDELLLYKTFVELGNDHTETYVRGNTLSPEMSERFKKMKIEVEEIMNSMFV